MDEQQMVKTAKRIISENINPDCILDNNSHGYHFSGISRKKDGAIAPELFPGQELAV
jgi:hypothetical protein